MSWPNERVLEFIELYKREEAIWNPKHPQHKEKSGVNACWERIRSDMSIPCSVLDLKKKKESLMTSFRVHMHRKNKSPTYQPTWFAFPTMESFLGSIYERDYTAQMDSEIFDHSYNAQTPSQPGKLHNWKIESRLSTGKLDGIHINNTEKHMKMEKNTTRSYLKRRNSDDIDECELYVQLLAKKLRKLNERQRDVAMHEIDNIMFKSKSLAQQKSFSPELSPVNGVKSPVFIITQQNDDCQFVDENIPFEETKPQGS